METRICRYCTPSAAQPLEAFPIANIIKGKIYRRWKCNRCYVQMKTTRKREIREWFVELKKTLKCIICGEDTWYMLDFHHRDPKEKEMDLSIAVCHAWSKKRILKEVAKCDIYCANHHRELHWKEKQ